MCSIRNEMQRACPVLLPDKHLRLSESVLGLAGFVLSFVGNPTTFDALWNRIREQLESPEWPASHGVENFALALCFLYTTDILDVTQSGELYRIDGGLSRDSGRPHTRRVTNR